MSLASAARWIFALAALSACTVGDDGSGDDGSLEVLAASDGSLVVASSGATGYGEALVTGRVAVLRAGCVGLWNGGEEVLVVWPEGTIPLDDEVGVAVPGLGELRVGDEVSAGGAFGSGDSLITPVEADRCKTPQVVAIAPS
jgi:hypothetical protein